MTLNIKAEPTFGNSNGEWLAIDPSIQPNLPPETNITLGCYNVLFPGKSRLAQTITSDQQRYTYQIDELLPQMDIDILALSEVTKTYIDRLMRSKWVQENYYIFNPNKIAFQQFFGNLILSKFPMKCYAMDNLIYGRIAVGLVKPLKRPSFLVLSIHLIAFEKNHSIRRKQLKQILEALKSYSNKDDPFFEDFQSAVLNKNVILMGDLNFHLKHENSLVYENNLIDLWSETNEGDGYSWDTANNSLINFILPFDNRRMRLDRIFFMEGATFFQTLPSEKMLIFGNKKIFPKKIISYLMGSDHFGLKVKIGLKENEGGYQRKSVLKESFDKSVQNDGFRSEKQIILYRVIFVLVFFVLIIFSIQKLFF